MSCSPPSHTNNESNYFPPKEAGKKSEKDSIPSGLQSITNAGNSIGADAAEKIKKQVKTGINDEGVKDTASAILVGKPKSGWNLEKILEIPVDLRTLILNNIPHNDLKALEIALSKGTGLDPKFKLAWERLHSQIKTSLSKQVLRNILKDHPEWENQVNSWKGISVEDKIWLLRLYELHQIGINIPQLTSLHSKIKQPIPFERTPELLKQRDDIEKTLAEVYDLKLKSKDLVGLRKCPDAICLLSNLKELYFDGFNEEFELVAPPDVSMNLNLEILNLTNAGLTLAPDVTRNIKLKELYLWDNKITIAPDVSRNVDLEALFLNGNNITTAPDVSRNVNLKELNLGGNKITIPPDVSHNLKLENLNLTAGNLKEAPNVRKNVNLRNLCLNDNDISALDVSQNLLLEKLHLKKNQFATLPNLKGNPNLSWLVLDGNKLSTFPDMSQYAKLTYFSIDDNPNAQPTAEQTEELIKRGIWEDSSMGDSHTP